MSLLQICLHLQVKESIFMVSYIVVVLLSAVVVVIVMMIVMMVVIMMILNEDEDNYDDDNVQHCILHSPHIYIITQQLYTSRKQQIQQ